MQIHSKKELLDAIKNGHKFSYLFFWGHKAKPDGSIGPSCLSQWFPAAFSENGINYATAEHYMMAQKADLFGDKEQLKKILAAASPKEAKTLGRKVKPFDPEIWESNAFDFVVKGNMLKFSQNPPLAHWLSGTSPCILVEASPTDRIWGIGLHKNDPLAGKPEQWNGENKLGFALVKVREHLDHEK